MEAVKNKAGAALMKGLRVLVAAPVIAVCYLVGWALMLLYGMGGAILSMGAAVTALGCGLCLWQGEYKNAALAALATWLLSPYGLPMVAMAAGSAALTIAGFLSVWSFD